MDAINPYKFPGRPAFSLNGSRSAMAFKCRFGITRLLFERQPIRDGF
jgi:hypothetical protein